MTSPGSVRSQVQTLLNASNPGMGRQQAYLTALEWVADALDAAGIERPPSLGTGRFMDYANIQAAAQAAQSAGEDGSFLGRHDGRVYTPAQMRATLHRYLLALGWPATTTQPAAPGVADAAPIATPATWRAALDQGGLTGSHVALTGTEARDPIKLPLGQVIDVGAYRLPGSRTGKAFAANVPAGAGRIETQANLSVLAGRYVSYGFSFQLARGFPVDQNYFHTIARIRNPDNSQPVGLTIWQGKLRLCARTADGYNHVWQREIGDVSVGEWHDVVWSTYLTTSASSSWSGVSFDGVDAIPYLFPNYAMFPTSGTPTLRYGLFRDPRSPGEACVYHANWAAGVSVSSVQLPGSG